MRWLRNAGKWIAGGLALLLVGAAALVGIRLRRQSKDLADQAADLAERDVERELLAAGATVGAAVEEGRAAAGAEQAAISAEVDDEARGGDLGDALDRLRGGG
jgi:hypothetical protein